MWTYSETSRAQSKCRHVSQSNGGTCTSTEATRVTDQWRHVAKHSRATWTWVMKPRVKTRRRHMATLFSATWETKQKTSVTIWRRQVTEHSSDKWTSRKATCGRTRRLLTDGHVPFCSPPRVRPSVKHAAGTAPNGVEGDTWIRTSSDVFVAHRRSKKMVR